MYNLFVWLSGLLFSVVLGHIGVKWLNFALIKYIGCRGKVKEEIRNEPAKLTPTLGCIERIIYTVFVVFQQHNYVATLFGIKIAQRLITSTKITSDTELRYTGERANVFMICNIVSLCFGFVGGVLIRYFTSK